MYFKCDIQLVIFLLYGKFILLNNKKMPWDDVVPAETVFIALQWVDAQILIFCQTEITRFDIFQLGLRTPFPWENVLSLRGLNGWRWQHLV